MEAVSAEKSQPKKKSPSQDVTKTQHKQQKNPTKSKTHYVMNGCNDQKIPCSHIKWTNPKNFFESTIQYCPSIPYKTLLQIPHIKCVLVLLEQFTPKQILSSVVTACIDKSYNWTKINMDKGFPTTKIAGDAFTDIIFGDNSK